MKGTDYIKYDTDYMKFFSWLFFCWLAGFDKK